MGKDEKGCILRLRSFQSIINDVTNHSRFRKPDIFAVLCIIVLVSQGCATPDASAPVTPDKPTLKFSDITAEAGLGEFEHVNGAAGDKWFPETMGSGAGFIDFNGDGWEDIILVGGGAWNATDDKDVRKLWLYRNDGHGSFKLQRDQPAFDDLEGYGIGLTAADYDNDGDEDIFFTTLGPNHLLRNDRGVYHDVTVISGLSAPDAWSAAATFFDADRDGFLDLYVGNYVAWTPETDIWCSLDGTHKGYCTPELYKGIPGRFYHNRGDGTFEDRTDAAGFNTHSGKSLGAVTLDFNHDGWPDLAVANDTDPDFLYRNRGDGTFEEVGVVSGIAFDERGRARAGMGITAGVVDSTGEETLFIGNFSNQMTGVYRHIGGGVFLDRAATSRIGRASLPVLSFGLALFDVDLDRDMDLLAADGHVQPDIGNVADNVSFRQPPQLFLNDGHGRFDNVAPKLGGVFTDSLVARAVATADIDNDGDLDVLVTENAGPAHLWRNDLTPGNNFLRVRLEGQRSNRDAVGARVSVQLGGRWQYRRIRSGSGYLSVSEKMLTFGLGARERIDSLVVFWPSGTVTRQANLPGGQILSILEPASDTL